MFSNAKSVEINGKEVKSIILENGAILYKKDESYSLSVTSDKNILSHYDNDVATLTATLTHDGMPVQGEEIIFHTNKPIKKTVIYSSGDTITLNEGEEILIPKNAQFNIDTGTNGSGDYFHWNNGDFEYGNINGDITITSSDFGRTKTVPKVFGTLNTVSSVTIKKVNGEYIVEDSNSDLVVEYSPNYDNGTLTTNLEIELGGEIDTISLITNNNGIVTYQYNSQGIGDIIFDVSCMNLQETYVLEDTIYYNSLTSAPNGWTIPSSANVTYSSDGMKLQGSSWTDCYLEIPLTKPYTVEFDLIDYIVITTYIYDSSKSTRYIQMFSTNGNTTVLDTYPNYKNKFSGNIPKGSHVKMEIDESNVKLYVENVLKLTKSYTLPQSTIFGISISANSSTTWKNIKVKPL